MKEFLLVFRKDTTAKEVQQSPEQFQAIYKQWQDWIGSLAAQNKFSSSGKRLAPEGQVVKSDKAITNGPFVEIKEAIQGYMFVKADSLNEATELAKGCPILQAGGSVEVRPVMEENS